MSHSVELSEQMYSEARHHASVNTRSLSTQVEHWMRIGKIAEENPDLPYEFIKGILIGLQEIEDGQVTDYQFG